MTMTRRGHGSRGTAYYGAMRVPRFPFLRRGDVPRSRQALTIGLRDVDYSYPDGTHALTMPPCDISAPVTVVVGLNGSGKTTLLRLIAGELSPTRGTLTVTTADGSHSWSTSGKRNRRVPNSIISSTRAITIPARRDPTVADTVSASVRDGHGKGSNTLARTADLLAVCHLSGHGAAAVSSLDSLHSHLLSLATALAHDPWLIVADEPTRGLAGPQVREVADVLLRCGAQIVLSTHDMTFATLMADGHPTFEALVLDGGALAAQCPLSEGVSRYDALIDAALNGRAR